MDAPELLIDAFDRVNDGVHRVMDGLDPGALMYRPDAEANPIAWLIWHASRIQDVHLADLVGRAQLWTSAGWAKRFALPLADRDTGFGHSSAQVDLLGGVVGELLVGYHDALTERVRDDVDAVVAAGLDRVVDERWDPPVTAGVRLVSVLEDSLQHVGQAAYVRGLHGRLAS